MDFFLKVRFLQLFTAIKNKNTDEIRTLLRDLGVYVNNKNSDGRTPLHEVAKLGDLNILKLFVEEKDVCVNVKDNHGLTPLHYVIERNENLEESCRILIEAGAYIAIPDKNGKMPLHALLEKKVSSKMIKSLIDMNGRRGEFLLLEAVINCDVKITQLLIGCGYISKCVSPDGSTLLHEVAIYGNGESHFEVAKLLLKTGLDVNAQDYLKNTALHYLINKAGNIKMVELYLKYEAQVNIKNDDGEIPLFKAISAKNLEVVRLLIDHGSDVNNVNKYGTTVLHKAISCNNGNSQFQIFELMLNAGANVHMKDKQGQTALFEAVRGENDKIVQMLLDHDSDINTIDTDGSTVLHQASNSTRNDDNLSTVEVLLKNGANVNAQDESGKTPLHLLVNNRNRNNVKTIEILLNYEPDVNIKDKNGQVPLFGPIKWNKVEIVKLLIDYGTDVNCTDNFKQTALQHAAYYYIDSCEILKYLLKNGAADALDSEGQTALLFLLQNSSESCDFDKTLQFMLKYSDINIINQTENELLSFTTVKEIWKIVLRHVAKLQALELPTNPAFKNYILNKTEFNDYFSKCLKELTSAKSRKLKDCWVTYFNLLIDNRRQLKNYAGNFGLIKEFKKSDCSKKFPIYGSEMQVNLEKGKKRRKLFDKSAGVLSNNWPIFGPTHLIIRDILDSCLSTRDLSKFCV